MTLAPGTKLSRYRVEGLLGRGGMGEVYKAHDETLDRSVALKVLRHDLTIDEDRVLRFTREARMSSALNHPNLVHIYDVGQSDGISFIAMEYVDGVTLREAAVRQPLRAVLRYLAEVAGALAKAHAAGIIHRDLKPDNILISTDGCAKVVDFGLAKLMDLPGVPSREEQAKDRVPLTEAGLVVGTIGYMAPEQVRGQPTDHRADIFAFGCILHEVITRARTFEGSSAFETLHQIVHQSPARLPPTAPPLLQRIVDRCLAKEPSSRYPTLSDAADDLHTVLQQTDSEASAPTVEFDHAPIELPARPHRRRALAAGLLLTVLFAAVVLWRRKAPATAEGAQIVNRPSAVARAYDDYMRARVNVSNENPANNDKAIQLLESAVSADSKLAPAYAELARAYNIKSFYYAPRSQRAQLDEDAEVAVEKALALDPNLADAHLAQGFILWTHANHFPHEGAANAYKEALSLNPRLDEAHHQLGVIYFHVGLLEKARKEIDAALSINPANSLARFRYGVIDMYSGHYEAALAVFRNTPLKKNPSLWAFQTATVLYRLGREREASDVLDDYLKRYPQDEGGVGTSVKAMMLAASGKREEAEHAIDRAIRLGEGYGHFHHTAYNIGSAYALLHRPQEAVKWLEAAADDGFPCYPLFRDDTNLANLRDDPRFSGLLNRLKIQSEHYKTAL